MSDTSQINRRRVPSSERVGLGDLERPPAWFALAACRGRAELFYPPSNERPTGRQYRELRASYVCRICPAVAECRAWAREHREFGYWGGESEAERTVAGFPPVNPLGRRAWNDHVVSHAEPARRI